MKTKHQRILSAPAAGRHRHPQAKIYPSRFGAALGGLVLMLALSASSAVAQCKQWDASGEWTLQQSNGYSLSMDLRQSGKVITGTARFMTKTRESKIGPIVDAPQLFLHDRPVEGNLEGDDFYVKIASGVYRGKVGPQGRIDGTTYDADTPSSKATWFSTRAMQCADGNTVKPSAPSAPAGPKPGGRVIKSTGRAPSVQGTTAATISASPQSVRLSAGQKAGTATLTWDAGINHPNVRLRVAGNGGTFTVPAPRSSSRQVKVESGKTTYTLIDSSSGEELGSATVTGE